VIRIREDAVHVFDSDSGEAGRRPKFDTAEEPDITV
jgi:hypothetical protein